MFNFLILISLCIYCNSFQWMCPPPLYFYFELIVVQIKKIVLLNFCFIKKNCFINGISSICPTIDNFKNFAIVYVQTLDVHNGRYFIKIRFIFAMQTS